MIKEYLSLYLPHKLKGRVYWESQDKHFDVELYGILQNYVQISSPFGGFDYCNIEDFMPILHPISDLVKEITYGGEKFVPHDRLQLGFLYKLPRTVQGKSVAENRIVTNTMSYTDWLQCIKWKIDVNDLISQEKAIDINTI